MQRFTILALLAAACFAVTTLDQSTASAQQFISQTYDLGDSYSYQQPIDRYHTRTIPYWQAYGRYTPNYHTNHYWPTQDYLPQQRYTANGFYSNGFYSNTSWSNQMQYSNRYQPIQSNPRSNQNRRVIHVRLR